MNCIAHAPRLAAEPSHSTLPDAIVATGRRSRTARAELMPVLLRYWLALASHELATRRGWFAATRDAVRSGATTARAFAAHALGDADEDIVFDAVVEYVGAHPVSLEQRQSAVAEAIDWVRRGLVLDRGAAFAALLTRGDAAINDALAGLRLGLAHDEIATVCGRAVLHPCEATRAFLDDWRQLLDAAEPRDLRAVQLVGRALDSGWA